jgi:hypothetical protein
MSSTTLSGPSTASESLPVSSHRSASVSSPQTDLRTQAADAISDVAGAAKQAADSLMTAGAQNLKAIANQQVSAGADLVGHVGASVRAAAGNLESNAPHLAKMVFSVAHKIEQSADQLRGQSIDQIAKSTMEFARQRPEVVFGAAAVCGFVLFRMFSAGINGISGPSNRSVGNLTPRSDPDRLGQLSPSLPRR